MVKYPADTSREDCSRSMRRICRTGERPITTAHDEAATARIVVAMALLRVRRPGYADRARQLPGEGRKHDRCNVTAAGEGQQEATPRRSTRGWHHTGDLGRAGSWRDERFGARQSASDAEN